MLDVFKQFTPKAGKLNKRFKKGLADYHAIAFSNDFPQLPVTATPEEHATLQQEQRVRYFVPCHFNIWCIYYMYVEHIFYNCALGQADVSLIDRLDRIIVF